MNAFEFQIRIRVRARWEVNGEEFLMNANDFEEPISKALKSSQPPEKILCLRQRNWYLMEILLT